MNRFIWAGAGCRKWCEWSTAWFIFAGFALVVALAFMLIFPYKREQAK